MKTLLFTALLTGTALAQHQVTKVHPMVLECEKIVEGLNQEKSIENSRSKVCRNQPAAQRVVREIKEITKCVDSLLAISTLREDLINQCLNLPLRESLRKKDQVSKCLSNTREMNFGEDQLSLCRDRAVASMLHTPGFQNCFSVYAEAYPDMSASQQARSCTNKSLHTVIESSEFASCKESLASINIGLLRRTRYCLSKDNRSASNVEGVLDCNNKLKTVVGESHSGNYCLDMRTPFKNLTAQTMSCLQVHMNFLEPNYIDNEEKSFSALRFVEDMIQDCQKPDALPTQNKGVQLKDALIFSTNSSLEKTTIGGLSGLSYNQKTDSLFVISDDPGRFQATRFYQMRLTPGSYPVVTPEYVTTLDTKVGQKIFDIDAEGIVVTNAGEVIVSSESLIKDSKSFIKVFNDRGQQINEIILSDKFYPKMGKIEKVERYRVYPPGNRNFPPGQPTPQPTQPSYEEHERRYFVTQQIEGIFPNKGFESLTGNKEGTILFTANEAPLVQDVDRQHRLVRIAKIRKVKNAYVPKEEFAYELENNEDNGLVDMAYISEDKLLTLERSYDARRNKVTAKIYMTDLKGAVDYSNVQSFQKHSAEQKVVPVKKKLLLDLDDLLPSLPKALRKIDNIEGIAIGPKLPNGNSTILLVSDNNFSRGQFTQLLVLEFNQAR